MPMWNIKRALGLAILMTLLLVASACDTVADAPATATPTQTTIPTDTTTPTLTPSPTPSSTKTATATTTATSTPTSTTPPTQTPTITPTPFNTALPVSQVVYDNLDTVNIPDNIRDGIDGPRIVFITQNDRDTVRNLSTAQPTNNLEIIYFASPTVPGNRVPVLEVQTSTGSQIFPAPRGNAIAYFVTDITPGLYVLDIEFELTQRVLALPSLTQRGFASPPAWTPDGTQLSATRENGYELDIYNYELSTGQWTNLTNHPAMDFWPVWSPDARYMAFLSDRQLCPSWIPTDVGACDPDTDAFLGGHVHVLDTVTGSVIQLSDQLVSEPESLRWINARQIVFAGGDPLDLLNPTRTLWIGDVTTGTARQVPTATNLSLAEAWSPDGTRVLYQSAGETSQVILSDIEGRVLATFEELAFARFSMVTGWSADGNAVVVGGSGGQCPYGVRVVDGNTYNFLTRGGTPPSMCSPIFSPEGQFIAYTGVNPTIADGRTDIYVANANGRGAINITGDLRGANEVIGWVAP